MLTWKRWPYDWHLESTQQKAEGLGSLNSLSTADHAPVKVLGPVEPLERQVRLPALVIDENV